MCKPSGLLEWTPVFYTTTGDTNPLDMDALDDLIIYQAQMCLGAPATGTYNCVPLTEDDASNLPGYINPELNSNLKRMIAVLSGKGLSRVPEWYCPVWDGNAGACTMPESGKIFNKRIGVLVTGRARLIYLIYLILSVLSYLICSTPERKRGGQKCATPT